MLVILTRHKPFALDIVKTLVKTLVMGFVCGALEHPIYKVRNVKRDKHSGSDV